MAPIIGALKRSSQPVQSLVCVTGQHKEMLAPILTLFDLQPDFDLGVMQPDQTLPSLTACMLNALNPVVVATKPDWILAQGDTTSVLVAALVAYYNKVRYAHVEAGLRTGDKYQPFPEEGNRLVADVLADRLFAPTERSRQALLREGVPAERIELVGNTVVDALLTVANLPYDWGKGPLTDLPHDQRLVLVTAHRRESFGQPLRDVCLAIKDLAERFRSADVAFVYPVHLNPHVQQPVMDILAGCPNVYLIPPLDYLSLVQLMKRCELILTDSGGIQEEAPSFHVPVLIMRETTERPEGVELGAARLVGTDPVRIVEEAGRLLTDPSAQAAMTAVGNPYGDGHAAERIVASLIGRTVG